MDEELKKRIDEMVHSQKVFLFMKGTPDMPQCGFSARVVDVLVSMNVEFGSFNVFDDESVRQGIKEYGDWPTIPQLYVDGKLIGGCDIVCQMAANNELEAILK